MNAAQHEFQRSFSAAVFDPSAPLPFVMRSGGRQRAQSGFAVYRNNAVAGLINVIVQRFPVVHRLAGADSFQAVAHRYVVTEPPSSPILLHYGETFPRFVRGLGSEATLEYLADIAELEWARGRAYHAADAEPGDARCLRRARLGPARQCPHPASSVGRAGEVAISDRDGLGIEPGGR